MNAVDTNVLIYRLDRTEPIKRGKARALLKQMFARRQDTVLLWQVAGELLRQLRSWEDLGRMSRRASRQYLASLRSNFALALPTSAVLDRALDLTDRFSHSHWDSMLLAACLEVGLDMLFTEDMGAPIRYDGVQLVNPFI